MRSTPFVVAFVVWAGLLASVGTAQTVTGPTIHSVTLHEGAGVLTITGTGFGREAVVTLDGQPVPVLPGATATQIDVLAPAAVLTTPGTYRLTVVDPVRQVGDAFVVASQAGSVVAGGTVLGAPPVGATGTAPASAGSPRIGRMATVAPRSLNGPAPLFVEESASPYRTALGIQALFSNTTGIYNMASGYRALRSNTTGNFNTASGAQALFSNTTGGDNTASGLQALYSNTTGSNNTASGSRALVFNTTGDSNTASGDQALAFNTTGQLNTASGQGSLYSNTTGANNTASGSKALYLNTTGIGSTANGFQALYANTTGDYNTASGYVALSANTTGTRNTASGAAALLSNTTGDYNTAAGEGALYLNTTGSSNTASGGEALLSNTTGALNTASGMHALHNSTTGNSNAAFGNRAGFDATTGSYNLFLGADVTGTGADANTIRIGLPYDGTSGQNQTFIAGIYGTPVSDWRPVVIDANGQLGTVNPETGGGIPAPLSGSAASRTFTDTLAWVSAVTEIVHAQQQQLQDQQATIADLRARLARVEALLAPTAKRK